MSLKANPTPDQEISDVTFTLDHIIYHIPLHRLADLIYGAIPAWLKDSYATIPVENAENKTAEQIRKEQGNLEMARAAIKGIVAALGMLPEMGHQLYGPEFRLGRNDSLPLIAQWMTWFIVSRLVFSPATIETVEATDGSKIVTSIRRSNGDILSHHSQEPCDNCPQSSESTGGSITG